MRSFYEIKTSMYAEYDEESESWDGYGEIFIKRQLPGNELEESSFMTPQIFRKTSDDVFDEVATQLEVQTDKTSMLD